MIHKSFSKQDLKDIITEFGLDIANYSSYNKYQLSVLIRNYLHNENEINLDTNRLYDNIETKEDLIQLLEKQNPHKLLTVKDKIKVMAFCKEVIHFCNAGFVIENTDFNSIEEITIQMKDIQRYGDIPSVRRACRLMNMNPCIHERFNPDISYKVQLELDLKRKKKVKKYNCLIRKHGHFTLCFG